MTDPTQINYVFFETATGRILQIGSMPSSMLGLQEGFVPSTTTVLETDDLASLYTDYILNGAVTPRPVNPSTLSGMTISNVPNPSGVTVGTDAPVTVTDGVVDLSFTQPGSYTVQVQSWPMLDAVFTVTQP